MRLFLTTFLICYVLSLSAQQKMLTPIDMQGDLYILHDAWVSLHPGLYRYNTPAEIEARFKLIQQKCARPLSEKQFFILLSQLAQKIKCGHTYLNPLNQDKETTARLLPTKVIPFFFEIINQNHMIITSLPGHFKQLRRGDEITEINGIPVRRILDSLLTVSRSDGNHAIGKKYFNINETSDEAGAYSLFDIYYPLFFSPPTNWTFVVKHFKAIKATRYTITPLTLSVRADDYKKRYGDIPTGKKSWAYKRIDMQTAYMKFGTFAFWNSKFDEKRFVDSIFADLQFHPNVRNIIIDIRNNEGGDNTGDYILSYITSTKLGCDDPDHPCFRFLTIPDSLLRYLPTWDKSFKAPKDPAQFFLNRQGLYEQKPKGDDCAYINPMPNRFKGNVFLMINAKNSSAGYEMARNVKVNRLGILIGETTGGSQQGINGGEFFFLTLPHSKFEIDLPLIYNYHPNKPDSGIDPDFNIADRQPDIAKNKDTQLLFVLSLIKKNE